MRASLDRLRDAKGSPFDGILLEYVNPLDGGPTLPTMSCRAQLLRPGEHTRAHRALSSTIYLVLEGEGRTIVEGTSFEWQRGTVLVVPNWHWHEIQNLGSGEAVLFSVTDQPVMEKLGMYREEAFAGNEGHQPITSTFSPV
jgi:gentisate 1,2-dioxygenase